MSVTVNIGQILSHYANDQVLIEVSGNTVGVCLKDLAKKFPSIEKALFSQSDQLRNFISVYINRKSVYPDELQKPVKDGDEIQIILLIGGG
jgi:molybdopterin converting factor small subunit